MIKLSNGHSFEYMAAAGALGFDGKGWFWERPLKWLGLFEPSLFTIVTKTLTYKPRKGNLHWYKPWACIRFIPGGGIVNAVSLNNPGIERWCKEIGSSIHTAKLSLVGSIFGEPDELALMAQMLNRLDLVGLELNVSCPNTEDDVLTNTAQIIESCRVIKSVSRFPIILKLSVANEVEKIVNHATVKDCVEAFSINSVPWHFVFPQKQSPFVKLGGGGVSGKAAQSFTWGIVEKLVKLTTISVIGPSVWDFEDIAKLWALGAKAISFGAIFLRYPWRPTLFVQNEQS